MAGESADRAAHRMRERAERLHRTAALWECGALGERRTAEALAALPAHEWTVFHDVPWPGRARANIDHVAVGPTGVFVIDSKNWSGPVTVRDGILRQNGYRRDKTIAGAVEAASAVASLVPAVRRADIRPVLCFIQDRPLTAAIGAVAVTSPRGLVDELQARPLAFTPEGREGVAWELELRLHPGVARPSMPTRPARAARPPTAKRTRRRTSQGLVSRIVGVGLAVGVLGVAFSHPEVFERFGHAFVSLVADDTDQPPADEPVDKPKDAPKKDRPTK